MIRLSVFVALFAIVVIIVFVKQSPRALPINQQNLSPDYLFSPLKNMLPIISRSPVAEIANEIMDIALVNRMRCPKGWRRFGGSCYSLSNVTSTSVKVNQTCTSLHRDASLMYIRQSAELFYAAYILTTNHLEMLMIEINPHLFKGKQRDVKTMNMLLSNDYARWKQFEEEIRQRQAKYDKLDKHTSHVDNSIDHIVNRQMELQPTNFIKDEINHHSDDHHEYDNFGQIFNVCHQIKWNVVNKDSNVFILTTYPEAGKTVCVLSDNDPTMPFGHVCQYMIDTCLGNFLCGKSGNCMNTRTDFECSCFFFSRGPYCDKCKR
jgi:hypothetical protein